MELTNSCSQVPERGLSLSRLCGLLWCAQSLPSPLTPLHSDVSGDLLNNNSPLFGQQRNVPRSRERSAELERKRAEGKRERREHLYIQVRVCGMETIQRKVKRCAEWFAASACLGAADVTASEYTEAGRSGHLLPQQTTPGPGRSLLSQQGVPKFVCFFFFSFQPSWYLGCIAALFNNFHSGHGTVFTYFIKCFNVFVSLVCFLGFYC